MVNLRGIAFAGPFGPQPGERAAKLDALLAPAVIADGFGDGIAVEDRQHEPIHDLALPIALGAGTAGMSVGAGVFAPIT